MIGGSGERKTLRMVAQYADESNLTCPPAEIPRKLEALAAHCDRVGRDRSEITVSSQRTTCIAPTHEQAEAAMTRYVGDRGMDFGDPATRQLIESMVTMGDPDEVGLCDPWGPEATYSWSVRDRALTLAATSRVDGCKQRGAILTGEWTRVG